MRRAPLEGAVRGRLPFPAAPEPQARPVVLGSPRTPLRLPGRLSISPWRKNQNTFGGIPAFWWILLDESDLADTGIRDPDFFSGGDYSHADKGLLPRPGSCSLLPLPLAQGAKGRSPALQVHHGPVGPSGHPRARGQRDAVPERAQTLEGVKE